MDYGYSETCRYEVRIADRNKRLLGSGVLFVPPGDKFVYVFTVAHLFWYTGDNGVLYTPSEAELTLTYAGRREQVSNIRAQIRKVTELMEPEEKDVIFLHGNYDPGNRSSSWDAAVLRMEKESWMGTIKAFRFPSIYKDTKLIGWGYPKVMSGQENRKSGEADSYRETLPLEGEAKMYDSNLREIKFKHFLSRPIHDLDGYSGTGLYAEDALFFGVFSRDMGPEESGSYAWVTAWKVFWEILDACGNTEYKKAIALTEFELIDLNQQAWWMPESIIINEDGLMEDRYSVNLQSLLLGMTDPFTVILASVWKNGIGKSLEKRVGKYMSEHGDNDLRESRWQWIEYDEYFSDSETDLCTKDGIVVNLHAEDKNIYEFRQRILKILYLREEKSKESKLIVNIWSHSPREAFNALESIWGEKRTLEFNIDFLSTVSYSMLATQGKGVPWQDIRQTENRLSRMEGSDKKKELILCKDMETAVWWRLTDIMAGSESQEDVLLCYQSVKSCHPAMRRWIGGLRIRWCEIWRKHSEELINRLNEEDIDSLCWEIYLFQRGCQKDHAVRWQGLLDELKKYASGSVRNLLDMVSGQEDTSSLESFKVRPEDIARWARTATREEFRNSIPFLMKSRSYYWSAIISSIHGSDYVLQEIWGEGRNVYAEKILNQNVSGKSDIYLDEDAEYMRRLIRRENM